MKIDRLPSVATRGTRPGGRGRSSGSDSFFKTLASGEDSPAGALSSAAPLSGIDALLALQEVAAHSDPDSQGRRRGADLLDRLEDLRLSLLDGRLSIPTLERLSELTAARRARVRDPRLAEILGDIELRAAVELAKLGR